MSKLTSRTQLKATNKRLKIEIEKLKQEIHSLNKGAIIDGEVPYTKGYNKGFVDGQKVEKSIEKCNCRELEEQLNESKKFIQIPLKTNEEKRKLCEELENIKTERTIKKSFFKNIFK